MAASQHCMGDSEGEGLSAGEVLGREQNLAFRSGKVDFFLEF